MPETFALSQTADARNIEAGLGLYARVIYINVVKTPELLALQKDLMACVEASLGIVHQVSKTRPFAPHMTVAFRGGLDEAELPKQRGRFRHRTVGV
jgi:2'-5' RNA ligase